MTSANLPEVSSDALSAKTTREDSKLVLTLTGNADLRSQAALETYLFRVNEIALGESVSEVVVDLRRLEFMNSSCFKAFVSWIGQLQEIDHSKQYRIRFL